MARLIYCAAIAIILLTGVAFAAPGIPNRFYGTVSSASGPAPDGVIIDARINGVIVASTITSKGTYGYAPNVFDIADPDNNRAGKTISFFANGQNTGKTATFKNGAATEVDFAIEGYASTQATQNAASSGSQSPTNNPASSLSSTDAETSSIRANRTCIPEWSCGAWLSCIDGLQTRRCADVNDCNSMANRPILSQNCTVQLLAEEQQPTQIAQKEAVPQPNNPTGYFGLTAAQSAGAVAAILAVIAAAAYVRKMRRHSGYR